MDWIQLAAEPLTEGNFVTYLFGALATALGLVAWLVKRVFNLIERMAKSNDDREQSRTVAITAQADSNAALAGSLTKLADAVESQNGSIHELRDDIKSNCETQKETTRAVNGLVAYLKAN